MSAVGRNDPHVVCHIGITVPDLDAAIRWYQEVLSFDLVSGPEALVDDGTYAGTGAALVFGRDSAAPVSPTCWPPAVWRSSCWSLCSRRAGAAGPVRMLEGRNQPHLPRRP